MTTNNIPVKVYSASWCGFCRMVKQYLASKNVPFEEIDIEADRGAAEYIVNKTQQAGIPVTEIGEDVIIGFDREKIDVSLRQHKLVA